MSRVRNVFQFLVLLLAVAVVACAPKPAEEEAEPETVDVAEEPAADLTADDPMEKPVASAQLQGREGSGVSGEVTFTAVEGGVQIAASVSGVEPGSHGFHIHEFGDCSAADFTSAGGHFNPTEVPHAGPDDATRHAGDLGNIEVGEDGTGTLALFSDMLTVADGPHSVVGRGVILHEGMDDLTSQPTGAAGGRLACGVVAALEVRGMEGEMGGAMDEGGMDEGDGGAPEA